METEAAHFIHYKNTLFTVSPSVPHQCLGLQAEADHPAHSNSLAAGSTPPTVPASRAGHQELEQELLVKGADQQGCSLGQGAAVAGAVFEVRGVAVVDLGRHVCKQEKIRKR